MEEYFGLASLFVSVVVAIMLIRQTSLFQKQTHLAYAPYILPRFVSKTASPILHLKNVGNGSAIDINITIKSENGKELSRVNRFGFLPADPTHNTYVNLEKNPKVIIEGTYSDISEEQHKIKRTYTYPPKRGDEEISE